MRITFSKTSDVSGNLFAYTTHTSYRETSYGRRMSQPPTSCVTPSNFGQHVDWASKHGQWTAEEEEEEESQQKDTSSSDLVVWVWILITAIRLICTYHPGAIARAEQWSVSWRPTTVKWRQFSQSNRHSAINTRQTQYHEALPSSVNVQSHLTSSFANDGNASWYWVCRVPMVEWRLDCENCRHLTVVGLHDTYPRSVSEIH